MAVPLSSPKVLPVLVQVKEVLSVSSMFMTNLTKFSCEVALTFLSNKRKRPCEYVHEVGQPIWMGGAVELSNVHHIVLVLQHCRLDQ